MEEQIGLTSDNVTLSERIDDIKVTTYQMNAIFLKFQTAMLLIIKELVQDLVGEITIR